MADTIISGIYRIRNTVNGRFYVGSAINLKMRWYHHRKQLRGGKHHSRFLQFAWNKYGEAAFVNETLELVEDKTRLLEREQYWIDHLGAHKSRGGYNIAPKAGSTLGKKLSEEARARMREARMTPEARAANSARQTGKKRSPESMAKWATWVATPEGKEAMRLAHVGHKATDAAREANRRGQIGRRHSEETKEKMRQNGLKRKHSEDSKRKMSITKKGKKFRIRSDEEKIGLRAKLSASRMGRRISEATKAKIGAANSGERTLRAPEVREALRKKLSALRKERNRTIGPEQLELSFI